MAQEFPIGIDFGFTYSVAAVCKDGNVDTIPNDHGNIRTPSCVSLPKSSKVIGDLALQFVEKKPSETFYGMKSLLGRKYNDPIVLNKMNTAPFIIKETKDGRPVYEIDQGTFKRNTTFTAEELAYDLIHHLKLAAETFLKHPVNSAVVTVPGHYNDLQRQSTKAACEKAGIHVMAMINETTAAAIAYFTKKRLSGQKLVLVFDVGGGSANASLIHVNDQAFNVLATVGGADAGGDDYDDVMFEYFRKQFLHEHGKDVITKKKAIAKLRRACEKAKRNLSFDTETTVQIECLYDDIDFTVTLTRTDFENYNQHLLRKSEEYIMRARCSVDLKGAQIDYALLVGGSTRIPKLKEIVLKASNCRELKTDINLEESVAHGAALLAKSISCHFLNLRLSIYEKIAIHYTMVVEGKQYQIFPSNTVFPTKKPNVFRLIFVEKGMDRNVNKDYEICIAIDQSRRPNIDIYQGNLFLRGILVKTSKAHELHLWFNLDSNGILTVDEYDAKLRGSGPEMSGSLKYKPYDNAIPNKKRETRDHLENTNDYKQDKKSCDSAKSSETDERGKDETADVGEFQSSSSTDVTKRDTKSENRQADAVGNKTEDIENNSITTKCFNGNALIKNDDPYLQGDGDTKDIDRNLKSEVVPVHKGSANDPSVGNEPSRNLTGAAFVGHEATLSPSSEEDRMDIAENVLMLARLNYFTSHSNYIGFVNQNADQLSVEDKQVVDQNILSQDAFLENAKKEGLTPHHYDAATSFLQDKLKQCQESISRHRMESHM